MRLVYRRPSFSNALALREFIFEGGPMVFGLEHPLGFAFRALDKVVAGIGSVSTEEELAVGELDLKAELVMELKRSHPRPYELRGHLRNSERCRPLLFEANVIKYVLEQNVRCIRWRRYEEGVTDIVTEDPALQVECKLVTGEASLERLLRKAFRNSHQAEAGKGPFVLVTGTESQLDAMGPQAVVQRIKEFAPQWFRQHQSVAFVVLMLPMAVPKRPLSTSLVVRYSCRLAAPIMDENGRLQARAYFQGSGRLMDFGAIVSVRSEVAIEQLQDGFNFVGSR